MRECFAEEASMSGMGTFRTTIMVEHTEHRGEMRTIEDALVDTGSEYTWVSFTTRLLIGERSKAHRHCSSRVRRKGLFRSALHRVDLGHPRPYRRATPTGSQFA